MNWNHGESLSKVYYTIKGLKDYLGEDVFQWIAASTLYPEINWGITLAIGIGLIKEFENKPELLNINLDYQTLDKISKIPWLHQTNLDDSFKEEIGLHIDPKVEKVARREIVESLSGVDLPSSSFANSEKKQIILKQNRFLKYRQLSPLILLSQIWEYKGVHFSLKEALGNPFIPLLQFSGALFVIFGGLLFYFLSYLQLRGITR